MTQREINRLDSWERTRLLEHAARKLDSALNLFGIAQEPISGLLESETEEVIEARLREIMTPDNDAFPPSFIAQAMPAANAFMRLWRQVAKSPA